MMAAFPARLSSLAENVSQAFIDQLRRQQIGRVAARMGKSPTTSIPTIFLWSATARKSDVT